MAWYLVKDRDNFTFSLRLLSETQSSAGRAEGTTVARFLSRHQLILVQYKGGIERCLGYKLIYTWLALDLLTKKKEDPDKQPNISLQAMAWHFWHYRAKVKLKLSETETYDYSS